MLLLITPKTDQENKKEENGGKGEITNSSERSLEE
jgi:hypothetical protein